MYNEENKENIDPECYYGEIQSTKRVKLLKTTKSRKRKSKFRVTKLPEMTLTGKIAEEIHFSDETNDVYMQKETK